LGLYDGYGLGLYNTCIKASITRAWSAGGPNLRLELRLGPGVDVRGDKVPHWRRKRQLARPPQSILEDETTSSSSSSGGGEKKEEARASNNADSGRDRWADSDCCESARPLSITATLDQTN